MHPLIQITADPDKRSNMHPAWNLPKQTAAMDIAIFCQRRQGARWNTDLLSATGNSVMTEIWRKKEETAFQRFIVTGHIVKLWNLFKQLFWRRWRGWLWNQAAFALSLNNYKQLGRTDTIYSPIQTEATQYVLLSKASHGPCRSLRRPWEAVFTRKSWGSRPDKVHHPCGVCRRSRKAVWSFVRKNRSPGPGEHIFRYPGHGCIELSRWI